MVSRRAATLAAPAVALSLAATGAVAQGPAVSAFVPAGFEVERRIDAQIGGNARPDVAMVLVRTATAAAPADAPLARRLVVLKARSDGGYVQIGEGRRVLLCTRCGGAFFGVVKTPVTLRVTRKIVIAEQESGSRVVTFQRFRFRSQGAVGTRLIGVDVRNTDRATGRVVTKSTNLLTGRRIVTITEPGAPRTVRRSRVSTRPVAMEDVVRSAWL